MLERRLGEVVGEQVRAEMAGRGALATDASLRARVEILEHLKDAPECAGPAR